MKALVIILFSAIALCATAAAQSPSSTSNSRATDAISSTRPERPPVFRPTKGQIEEAQEKLRRMGIYSGDASGRYNDDFRASIRKFQKGEGIAETGNLNRITLEKLNIGLTQVQKQLPAPSNTLSPAKSQTVVAGNSGGRRIIFRATKDQVMEVQRKLTAANLYDGKVTGKLDPETRSALRKFQESKSIKVTGTLNQATLAAMGIQLTPTQEANEKK